MNDPAEITIDQAYFDCKGVLEVFGTVEHEQIEFSVDASQRTFDELLPKGFTLEQCQNSEGKFIARLDQWNVLHWLPKSSVGQIFERAVSLESWMEQKLYDTYIKNQ